MAGLLATLGAVAVIAALIVVGMRMKIPPPDPDWREKVPPDPPPKPRWWNAAWYSRWTLWPAAVLLAALGHNHAALAVFLVMIGWTLTLSGYRVATVLRARRQAKSA